MDRNSDSFHAQIVTVPSQAFGSCATNPDPSPLVVAGDFDCGIQCFFAGLRLGFGGVREPAGSLGLLPSGYSQGVGIPSSFMNFIQLPPSEETIQDSGKRYDASKNNGEFAGWTSRPPATSEGLAMLTLGIGGMFVGFFLLVAVSFDDNRKRRFWIGLSAAVAGLILAHVGLRILIVTQQKNLTSCLLCNTLIAVDEEAVVVNVLSKEKQVAVIGAPAEGSSIRSIERTTGVHRDTIMRLSVRVGPLRQRQGREP
jgi:hypothetical protein